MNEMTTNIISHAKFLFEVPYPLMGKLHNLFKNEKANSYGQVVVDGTAENLEKWVQFVATVHDAMPILDAAYRAELPMCELDQAQKEVRRAVEVAHSSLKEFELSIQAWGEHKIRAEARLALLAPALEMGRADLAKVEDAAKEAQEVCEVVAAAAARYASYRLSQAQ